MKRRIIALMIAAMLLLAACDTDVQPSETSGRSSLIRETEIAQNVQTVSSSPYAWGIKYMELPENCSFSTDSINSSYVRYNSDNNTTEIILDYRVSSSEYRFVLAVYDMTGNLLEYDFINEPNGYKVFNVCFSDLGYYFICKDNSTALIEYNESTDEYTVIFDDLGSYGESLLESRYSPISQ
nr:hypothetical protein [Clostridia bacterium]